MQDLLVQPLRAIGAVGPEARCNKTGIKDAGCTAWQLFGLLEKGSGPSSLDHLSSLLAVRARLTLQDASRIRVDSFGFRDSGRRGFVFLPWTLLG